MSSRARLFCLLAIVVSSDQDVPGSLQDSRCLLGDDRSCEVEGSKSHGGRRDSVLLQMNLGALSRQEMNESFTVESEQSSSCEASQIWRRRRNSDMCSCRRRSSYQDLGEGWVCEGQTIVAETTTTTTPCSGSPCPLGWSGTDEKKGESLWCEVAAPPSSWSALKACPSGDRTTKVKILTYNLFWWNLFERRGGGDAGGLIARTSGSDAYDLMAFQECKDAYLLLEHAKWNGLADEYAILELVKGDRALAMAYLKSRWTPLASGWQNVGEDQPWQHYGKRAVQWVRLQHTDGLVLFFINHHGPLPVSTSGNCAGSATAYNIMKVISENAYEGDAVVLVGDFNAQPGSSRVIALETYMHKIMTGSSHGGVDHIFSNCDKSHTVSTKNVGNGGSDHDVLSTVISFPHA